MAFLLTDEMMRGERRRRRRVLLRDDSGPRRRSSRSHHHRHRRRGLGNHFIKGVSKVCVCVCVLCLSVLSKSSRGEEKREILISFSRYFDLRF